MTVEDILGSKTKEELLEQYKKEVGHSCHSCHSCHACDYCVSCDYCHSCDYCSHLKNKRYCVFNVQLTKEQYIQWKKKKG